MYLICNGTNGFVGVFVCLFDLILYIPSTIFQLNREGSSWVEPVLGSDKCVLLKDHNAVTPVRIKPPALGSRVKHSTTEPLGSLLLECKMEKGSSQCKHRQPMEQTKGLFCTCDSGVAGWQSQHQRHFWRMNSMLEANCTGK